MLTPDNTSTINIGGESLILKEKIIPFGTRWAKNYGSSRVGDLYKEDKYMTVGGITIHNTDDLAGVADDAEQYTRATWNQNMGYARVHYYVDDLGAWQNLKNTEVGWHAGDGLGAGNFSTIAIEIIMNGSGNSEDEAAERNGTILAAWLLHKFALPIERMYTHNHWMGLPDYIVRGARKNCPVYILPRWNIFVSEVAKRLNTLNNPPVPAEEKDDSMTQEERIAFDALTARVAGLEGGISGLNTGIAGLNTEVAGLGSELSELKSSKPIMYETILDIPAGEFRETVQKLLDRKVIGDASQINMTYDMVRLLVAAERDKLIYHKINDVPEGEYRNTVKKLANRGILRGRGKDGDEIIIDLPDESIRLLVLLDRQGVFEGQ